MTCYDEFIIWSQKISSRLILIPFYRDYGDVRTVIHNLLLIVRRTTLRFWKPQRRGRSLAPEVTTTRRHRRRLAVFCCTRAHAEKLSFLKSRNTRAESFYEAGYTLAWHVICTSDFSAERFYCLTARRTRIYDTTTYPPPPSPLAPLYET